MPPSGGALFTKNGQERWYDQDNWSQAVADGWVPSEGQRVVDLESNTSAPVENLIDRQRFDEKIDVAPIDYQGEQARLGIDERAYGDEDVAAFGLGVGRGLTFGGSDILARALGADPGYLEALQRVNPVSSLTGELLPIVASGLVPGGQGNFARIAGLLPTVRLSQYTRALGAGRGLVARMGAEALEGYAYGFGYGVSQLAMKDEPLAAEALVQHLGIDPLIGAGLGGGLGAGAYGSQKLIGGLKGLKGATALDNLLDHTTPEGAEFVGEVTNRLNNVTRITDDLITTGKNPGLTKDHLVTLAEQSKGLDDVFKQQSEAVSYLNKGVRKPPDTGLKGYAKATYSYLREQSDTLKSLLIGQSGLSDKARAPLLRRLMRAQQVAKAASGTKNAATALDNYYQEISNIAESVGQTGFRDTINVANQIKQIADATESMSVFDAHVAHTQQAGQLLDQVKASRQALREAGGFTKIFKDADAAKLPLAKQYIESLEALNKHLGSSTDNLDNMLRGASNLDTVMTKAQNKYLGDPGQVRDLETAYERVRRRFGLGAGEATLTPKHVSQFMSQSPKDLLKSADELNELFRNTKVVANAQQKLDTVLGLQETMDEMVGTMAAKVKMSPEEVARINTADLLALVGLSEAIPDFEGPVDNILKFALIAKISHGNLKGAHSVGGHSAGKRLVERALSRAASYGAYSTVRKLTGSGVLGSMASALGSRIGFKGSKTVLDRLIPAQAASQAAGNLTATMANVSDAIGKGTSGTLSASGFTAHAVLSANRFGSKEDGKGKSLYELYEDRRRALSELVANPPALQQLLNDNTTGIRQGHLGLGDKTETKGMDILAFAAQTMPQDPGGMHKAGKSRWKATDVQIRQWARYIHGATNPMAVIRSIVNGTVTPQEAEALRVVWPATFMAFQREIAANITNIQENSTLDQRIKLSIVTGLPVDSIMSPDFRMFIQEQNMSRVMAQQSAGPQPRGGSMPPEPKTKSEQTDNRMNR